MMSGFIATSLDQNGSSTYESTDVFEPVMSTIEPLNGVAAQVLTSDGCSHCGWIKKEGNSNKTWRRRYMIIHKGCIYYFSDANSSEPKGNFSLQGYRVLQAHDRPKQTWVLKLLHQDCSKRVYYIAADSEPEMKVWLLKIREEVEKFFGSGSGDSLSARKPQDEEDGPSHTIDDYDYPDQVPIISRSLPSSAFGGKTPKMPLPPTPAPVPGVPGRSKSVKERTTGSGHKFKRSLTDPSDSDLPPEPPPREMPGKHYETPRFELPKTNNAPPPMPKPRPRPLSDHMSREDPTGPSLPPKPAAKPPSHAEHPIPCTEQTPGKPTPPPRPVLKPELNKIPAHFGAGFVPCGFPPSVSTLPRDNLRTLLSTTPPSHRMHGLPDPDHDDPSHYLEFESPAQEIPQKNTPRKATEHTEFSKTLPPRLVGKKVLPADVAEFYVIDNNNLPESANRLELDKTQAGQLLLNRGTIGTYMMCTSKTATTGKALSVLVDPSKHNTYIIFKDDNGYHLDPNEPVRCRSIDELIVYYKKNNLPRISCSLRLPYKP